MPLYSIKMRAEKDEKHVSGAEKLVMDRELASFAAQLVRRGTNHPKGKADFLNLKVERIEQERLIDLEALPVETAEVAEPAEGLQEVRRFLQEQGVERADAIIRLLEEMRPMRGAMLLDVDTLERLEPDKERGIRVTYLDRERKQGEAVEEEKNHYLEAIVLATKVAHAPHLIGEICISDDPDYVTGYVASKKSGYRRITRLKEAGSEQGGRIFLYRGDHTQVTETIRFLEQQPVIIKGVKELRAAQGEERLAFVEQELSRLKEQHLYRTLRTMESAQGTQVCCQGEQKLMLASNSYLGMNKDPQVIACAGAMLEQYGAGSGGSRLTTGNYTLHERLEEKLSSFKGTEAALLFNTGYVANLATISALMGEEDVIFSDEANHASIIDGCRLSKARIVTYRHNDMEDLEQRVQEHSFRRALAVSDAVFSMDGDILKLPEFLRICREYHLISMVDEAHATGVIGKTGRGIVEHFGLLEKPDVLMGTLSKALGSEGGYICGSRSLIEYLKNKARGFIFSTSLAPASLAAAEKALELIEQEPIRVQTLQENIVFFCRYLSERGCPVHSETAIIPLHIGAEEKAVELSERLYQEGIYLSAIRYPTVKKKNAMLRIALMSDHTREQLASAADTILRLWNREEIN